MGVQMAVVVDVAANKQAEDPLENLRAVWVRSIVQGVEYLLRDAAAPEKPEDAYPAAALATLRNMQALGEDLLASVERAGWITREQCAAILREARMGE